MSFEQVTRWLLRCDGEVRTGWQCPDRWLYPVGRDPEGFYGDEDEDDSVWAPSLFDRPSLTREDREALRADGWLVARDGRVLCPRHVGALEYLARTAVDGLPFDELSPETEVGRHEL